MDYADHTETATKFLAGKVAKGVVKYRYHILEGLKEAPRGIHMLFTGENKGKLYVQSFSESAEVATDSLTRLSSGW